MGGELVLGRASVASFVMDLSHAVLFLDILFEPLLADFPRRKSKTVASCDCSRWIFSGHVTWRRKIFSFALISKTQRRAFLGYLYVLFLDASRALDEWCAYAGLVCCARSCALTLGWSGGAKPVPSGMDWLGACPGGARPDFPLRSTFTDLFLPMPC